MVEPTVGELEQIATDVVDAAVHLHKALGPGLLESVYRVLLAHKLKMKGYHVKREEPIPIEFEGVVFVEGFKADLLINDCFIVEAKSVERLAPVHAKQLLTYLKLTGCRLGLLLNFGEELMRDGIKRVVNGHGRE